MSVHVEPLPLQITSHFSARGDLNPVGLTVLPLNLKALTSRTVRPYGFRLRSTENHRNSHSCTPVKANARWNHHIGRLRSHHRSIYGQGWERASRSLGENPVVASGPRENSEESRRNIGSIRRRLTAMSPPECLRFSFLKQQTNMRFVGHL
jgi:hypothetical protein